MDDLEVIDIMDEDTASNSVNPNNTDPKTNAFGEIKIDPSEEVESMTFESMFGDQGVTNHPGMTSTPATNESIIYNNSQETKPQESNTSEQIMRNSQMANAYNQISGVTREQNNNTYPQMANEYNEMTNKALSPVNNTYEQTESMYNPNQTNNINNNRQDIELENTMNISNMNINSQKMQSIEEQLSKTSQYNPDDFQQEKIIVESDNEYEKNRSGMTFVIILFVVLGLIILFLPQITKLIK